MKSKLMLMRFRDRLMIRNVKRKKRQKGNRKRIFAMRSRSKRTWKN